MVLGCFGPPRRLFRWGRGPWGSLSPMASRRIKLHYVLIYALLGSHIPYLPVRLHELGFDEREVGWILALPGVAIMITPALLGWAADRWVSSRQLMGILYATAALSMAALASATSMVAVVPTFLVFSLVSVALFPLMDGLALEYSGEPFSSIRVWGSVGFLAPSLLLAVLLHWLPVVTALWLAAACAAVGAWAVRGLSDGPKIGPETASPWESLGALTEPSVRAFLATVVILALSTAIYYVWFPLLLVQLGVADAWIGLIVNVGVLVEIACMRYAGTWEARLGLRSLMALGCGASALRMALLAATPSLFVAVAVQACHGLAVLSLYILPAAYVDHKVDPSVRNSAQGLLAFMRGGASRFLGAMVGAWLAPRGLGAVFSLGAVLASMATLCLLVGFRDRARVLGG